MKRSRVAVAALLTLGEYLSGTPLHAQSAAVPGLTVSPLAFPEGLDPGGVIGSLRYRGAVLIASDPAAAESFYGLSGFWVAPDGNRFAGTEGGSWFEGSLRHDDNGNLSGFAVDASGASLDENGQPFADDRDRDAEALDHDGTHYLVGFETHDRVLRYRDFRSPAEPVPLLPEALQGIAEGGGFSSVVHLSGGRLIALPEFTEIPRTRGWMVTEAAQGEIRLRRPLDWWLPASLSRFPNGDLLVLEIYQSPDTETTNVTRLGRIPAGNIAIGGSMEPVELATLQPPLVNARFEGSAIRAGSRGEELIYLMQNASPPLLFMFEVAD